MNPERPPTEFENRVFGATSGIPRGKVTTYLELARHLNCGSAQAIGQALKRNPFAPEVPCHRVVRSDLSLGGFHGQTGGPEIERKRQILLSEGVEVSPEGEIPNRFCHFFD